MDEQVTRRISGRMKIAALILSWLLIITFQVYWFREPDRMSEAKERQLAESVERGVTLYAENCVVCHGPEGEGVVGPPLQRAEWREGTESELEGAAEFLFKTIARGRPGRTITTWEFLPNGYIRSGTAMPPWHREEGGPLNDQMVRDLVNFIQYGDFTEVWGHLPAPKLEGKLPRPAGVSEAFAARAEELLRQKGCVTCHKFGKVGGATGPDLTYVGSWTDDEAQMREFLRRWITNPSKVERRAPQYWMTMNLTDRPMELPPTLMPAIPMTEEELNIVVEYLLSLKKR